jgi:electron transfer flavoprotein beta subunit
MEIVVCIKRVPDLAEVDVRIDSSGRSLDDSDFSWGMNEWDSFALEAALRLREAHGGSVTAITVGDDDAEDVLRRALAMGADRARHLTDSLLADHDPMIVAKVLAAALRSQPFDLILFGAVSSDLGNAVVGGAVAGLLDLPQVSLATGIELREDRLEVRHEVEAGSERVVELDLPAVVTVQTGIHEPRYVSIRGIRKVANVEIPVEDAGALGLDAGELDSRLSIEELSPPPVGAGAELLQGSTEEVVATIVTRLRERGGL